MRSRIRASTGAALMAALFFASATHAEDTNGPERTVSALWRAMSHEAGASADVATLRGIFHADAVIFGSRLRNGQASLRRSMAVDFLKALEPAGDAGFHECEIVRRIEAYDRFATVYSVVESRTDRATAKPDFTGVNSLQLYRENDGWKIVSLYYHVGPADPPVPGTEVRTGNCLD